MQEILLELVKVICAILSVFLILLSFKLVRKLNIKIEIHKKKHIFLKVTINKSTKIKVVI